VLGSVVGGLCLLMILAALYISRRRRRLAAGDAEEEGNELKPVEGPYLDPPPQYTPQERSPTPSRPAPETFNPYPGPEDVTQ
jgi:hypothetical protein